MKYFQRNFFASKFFSFLNFNYILKDTKTAFFAWNWTFLYVKLAYEPNRNVPLALSNIADCILCWLDWSIRYINLKFRTLQHSLYIKVKCLKSLCLCLLRESGSFLLIKFWSKSNYFQRSVLYLLKLHTQDKLTLLGHRFNWFYLEKPNLIHIKVSINQMNTKRGKIKRRSTGLSS